MRQLLLLVCFISLPLQAAITAQLDRYTLDEGESLLLTIEADQKARQRPQLGPLQQHFRILGSKQMTISSHAQGESHFTTRWRILLRPLRSGTLTLPALAVGAEFTPAFQVDVRANTEVVPGLQQQAQFLETELDTNELYVGSQALLKVRLFNRDAPPDPSRLSAPLSADALIRALGAEKQYRTQVKGQTYEVLERSYAIYPSHSGTLVLDPLRYQNGPSGAEPLLGKPIELAVLPRAFQKIPGFWLPATSVQLSDDLMPLSAAEQDQPLRRRITLTVHGLPAAALPALTPLKNELAEIRLDNVLLDEQVTAEGLISSRTEELTIMPLERGEVTLAPIEIPWWDVVEDRNRSAALDARLLRVKARPDAPARSQETPAPQAGVAPELVATSVNAAPGARALSDGNPRLLIWLLTAIALAATLGWWYSFNRMRRARYAEMAVVEEELDLAELPPRQSRSQQVEADAYELLHQACARSEPEVAKLRLIEWAQQFWPEQEIYNGEGVCDAAASQAFDFLVLDLEHHIYHDEEEPWRGDLLLEAVNRLRERRLHNRHLHKQRAHYPS